MMAMIEMLQVIESGIFGGIESIEFTLTLICMADIRYLVISKIEHNAFGTLAPFTSPETSAFKLPPQPSPSSPSCASQ